MDDTICVLKDKLNEALTLISFMSQPEKLEAVSHWNNAATHIQDLVNDDGSPIGQAQQQDPSRISDLKSADDEINLSVTNVDTNLDISGIGHFMDTPNCDMQDIVNLDNLSGQYMSNSIVGDNLSTQNNRLNETEQVQPGAIFEEIDLFSFTRLGKTQSMSSLGYNSDLSTEPYQDVPSDSLSILGPVSQQSIMHLSNQSCLLPSSTDSTSSSADQTITLDHDSTTQIQQADYCVPLNTIDQPLIELSLNNNPDSSSNLGENLSTFDPRLQYTRTIPELPNHLGDCEFEQVVSISQSNQNSPLVTSDYSQIQNSTTFDNMANSCPTDHSNEMRPFKQIQMYFSSTDNIEEFPSNGNTEGDHENRQVVGFSSRHSQSTAIDHVAQLSQISLPGTANYVNVCPQQTTNAPANVDFSTTESDEILYTCEVCGKSGFSSKGNLKRHLATHTGLKAYHCDQCKKTFTEKKSLKIHSRKHTGQKPYKCDVCHAQFIQKVELDSHILVRHNGARKFVCPHQDCAKSFKQKSQLTTHLKRHTGDRHVECTVCGTKFYSTGDLRRHSLVHTGERPYRCHQCPKQFTRKQSLNEHLNRHTGKKPFICDHCFKGFPDLSAYKKVMCRTDC